MLVYFTVFHRSLWRRKSQPAPVFLLGKSHQPRSLTGYIVHGIAKSRKQLSNLHYRSFSLCSLLFDLFFCCCSLDWIISTAPSSSLWISSFAFSIWFWISKPEIQKISWGTHVNPWLFRFNVWQNPLQIKKIKIKKNNRKKIKNLWIFRFTCIFNCRIFFVCLFLGYLSLEHIYPFIDISILFTYHFLHFLYIFL